MRDSTQNSNHIAILIHGFAGKKEFMKEIEQCLNENPFNEVYDEIFNLSYYNSKHGLDFSHPYDLRTTIYDPDIPQNLSQYFYHLILSAIKTYKTPVSIDVFAHSMGGIVTRAMIKYILSKKEKKFEIKRVIMMGTPNHGTRLAQKFINIPTDIFLTGLNILLELPRGGVDITDLEVLNSQFMQMIPKSKFLKELNGPLNEIEKSIKWVTIRGLNSSGLLEAIWQPFLFRKVWLNRKFPFINIGMIPNDSVVDAASVPLKHAKNLTVPKANHMNLLKWISEESGQIVRALVEKIIVPRGLEQSG